VGRWVFRSEGWKVGSQTIRVWGFRIPKHLLLSARPDSYTSKKKPPTNPQTHKPKTKTKTKTKKRTHQSAIPAVTHKHKKREKRASRTPNPIAITVLTRFSSFPDSHQNLPPAVLRFSFSLFSQKNKKKHKSQGWQCPPSNPLVCWVSLRFGPLCSSVRGVYENNNRANPRANPLRLRPVRSPEAA
jgi:hypothetical protein